jgi:hypothetical protein
MENERVYQPAVDYAVELALRMDSEVTFLILAEMAFADNTRVGSKRNAMSELDVRVGPILAGLSARCLQEGISTGSAIRVGDSGEEFLKFLAERPPFQAIIWGSGEDLPRPGRRSHWLTKAGTFLECPVLTVNSSRRTDRDAPARDEKIN